MSTPAATAADASAAARSAAARDVRTSAGKIGMWTFLATDAMGFFGLLVAYAVLRVHADDWPDAHERLRITWAAAMTGALVTSSFTMTLAARAAAAGRDGARTGWLLATLALGGAFLAGQALEYHELLTAARPMGLGADTFAGTFYAITGYHGLHVLAGLVLVASLLVAGRGGARVVEVVAIFWHFVDLAWIPIFSFVYLLPIT